MEEIKMFIRNEVLRVFEGRGFNFFFPNCVLVLVWLRCTNKQIVSKLLYIEDEDEFYCLIV